MVHYLVMALQICLKEDIKNLTLHPQILVFVIYFIFLKKMTTELQTLLINLPYCCSSSTVLLLLVVVAVVLESLIISRIFVTS